MENVVSSSWNSSRKDVAAVAGHSVQSVLLNTTFPSAVRVRRQLSYGSEIQRRGINVDVRLSVLVLVFPKRMQNKQTWPSRTYINTHQDP